MGPRSENRGYAVGSAGKSRRRQRLQWVHGPRTVVMSSDQCTECLCDGVASMGPRSENRGYAEGRLGRHQVAAGFNGSTVREPWLCRLSHRRPAAVGQNASMGPRSENRGYGPRLDLLVNLSDRPCFNGSTVREPWLCLPVLPAAAPADRVLQWVHGPRTVVMDRRTTRTGRTATCMLQWVHGPRTVVMVSGHWYVHTAGERASMGPRSENRGYAVVRTGAHCAGGVASMGPRSENRGYVLPADPVAATRHQMLQWVHGPRTVVMVIGFLIGAILATTASMGPRSENRGYARLSF